MMQPTLKQFRYFEALARHGHFGRAADASAISQPALSMQIKELEDSLGAALVERGGKRVELTDFGGEAAPRIRAILQAVDELGDLARMSQERLTGALRVGVIPTIGPYLLPQIIALLGRTHPDVDLRLRETLTQRLIAELHDRRLDAAIVALPVSEPTLVEVPLLTERFVFAHPPNDDGRPTPTAEELREMRLLLLEEGHCFREQALSFCDATTGPPREILDASSLSTLMQMVSAGFGVTLLPEMAIAIETRAAPVAIAHFPPPEPSRAVGMIWRKSNPLGPQLQQIAETIKADLSPP